MAINPLNELLSEKYFLDRDRKYEFLSQLWHKDISLTDYCFNIGMENESHMSNYGLHAVAAFFQVTIVVFSFLAGKVTNIYDGYKYNETWVVRMKAKKGLFRLEFSDFPNLIELYFGENHYNYVHCANKPQVADDWKIFLSGPMTPTRMHRKEMKLKIQW